MSARTAAQAMKEAIHKVDASIDVHLLPVADGGEGTLDVLTYAANGITYEKKVTDPLGRPVIAKYAILGDGKTTVVEIAQASGLHLVTSYERNPLKTTTYGTGELIKAALDHDVAEIIVTVGGSGTNDAGSGLLQALGVVITDETGEVIGFGGGALEKISHIDVSRMDPRLKSVKLSIATDVTNPLTGEKGASTVFGPKRSHTGNG